MQGETLTPYRRAFLYERAMGWATGEDPFDGDADDAHLLIHALAETPDGPTEVREDYLDEGTGRVDRLGRLTSQETISGWIEFYGLPEADPDGPVSVVVRVTAPREVGAERFDEEDLFQAVASAAHECYPADGQSEPTLATFERIRVDLDATVLDGLVVVLDTIAPHLEAAER